MRDAFVHRCIEQLRARHCCRDRDLGIDSGAAFAAVIEVPVMIGWLT
jgi:hypothetical protein